MADYIDRQTAINGIVKSCLGCTNVVQAEDYAIQYIKKIPSADVVEVVRCKDCKLWSHNVNYSYHWCGGRLVSLDDYCSNGVRKDG